nr:unnamed protein product [Callosobruchus chinensis]
MRADVIVVVNKGKIEAIGTYNELSSNNLDFSKLLKHQEPQNEEVKEVTVLNGSLEVKDSTRSSTRSTASSTYSATSDTHHLKRTDENEAETVSYRKNSPLKEYVKACDNNFLILSLLFVLILSQGLCSGADYWVAFWTTQEEIRHSSDSSPLRPQKPYNETIFIHNIHPSDLPRHTYQFSEKTPNMSQNVHPTDIYDDFIYKSQIYHLFKTDVAISIYGLLILLIVLSTIARSLMFFKMCMLSSINLHRRMFMSLLKAPIRFFNTNPTGRILNRFSKDMGAVDELLCTSLVLTVQVCNAQSRAFGNIQYVMEYFMVALYVAICIRYWMSVVFGKVSDKDANMQIQVNTIGWMCGYT